MAFEESLHPQETERLNALKELQVLDTPIEERFERITRIAKKSFDVPICAISCIDEHRQWFKSAQGMQAIQTDRCISFCQHTILEREVLIINDALSDDRFKDSPLVTGDPGVIFYAGVPIFSKDNFPVAAFCIIDHKPRELSNEDIESLKDFAKMVQYELYSSAPNEIENTLVKEIGESWRLTLIDPLTRLWNHEGIKTLLDQSLQLVRQGNNEIMVTMIDLCKFDAINKEYGHVSGDDLLRWLSKDLLKHGSEKDTLGRAIGNTFVLISNTTDPSRNAQSEIHSLQRMLDEYQIPPIKNRSTLGATLVTLVVQKNWNGGSEHVFNQLEDAMYNAKKDRYTNLTIPEPIFVNATRLDTAQLRSDAENDSRAA